jgi:hypothetical protein
MKKFMFPLALVVLMLTSVATRAIAGWPLVQETFVNACGDGTTVTFFVNGQLFTIVDGDNRIGSVNGPQPFLRFWSERGWQNYRMAPNSTATFMRAPDGCLIVTGL